MLSPSRPPPRSRGRGRCERGRRVRGRQEEEFGFIAILFRVVTGVWESITALWVVREWIPISTSPKDARTRRSGEFGAARSRTSRGELATAAEVTTGAIYHHFGSKLGLSCSCAVTSSAGFSTGWGRSRGGEPGCGGRGAPRRLRLRRSGGFPHRWPSRGGRGRTTGWSGARWAGAPRRAPVGQGSGAGRPPARGGRRDSQCRRAGRASRCLGGG